MATLDQFSALVGDIYDAAVDPSLWEQTLKGIATAAGGNVGALLVYDSKSPLRPHIITVNLDPVQKRNYDEYYGQLDPLAPILARTPAGVIVSNRGVTTVAQRRDEFYNDWAYPNEMGDNIVVNILDSPDGPCTLAIAHPSRSELFATPEVLRLVNLLVPHFQRAMQAQLGLGPLSLIRDGALDLVDQWRHGCVLVSFSGQVLYANRAANEIAGSRTV